MCVFRHMCGLVVCFFASFSFPHMLTPSAKTLIWFKFTVAFHFVCVSFIFDCLHTGVCAQALTCRTSINSLSHTFNTKIIDRLDFSTRKCSVIFTWKFFQFRHKQRNRTRKASNLNFPYCMIQIPGLRQTQLNYSAIKKRCQ